MVIFVSIYCAVVIKLWPQMRSFSSRLKSMVAVIEENGLKKDGKGGSLLEQAAAVQAEKDLAAKHNVTFKDDDKEDINAIEEIMKRLKYAKMSSMEDGVSAATGSMGGVGVDDLGQIVVTQLNKLEEDAADFNQTHDVSNIPVAFPAISAPMRQAPPLMDIPVAVGTLDSKEPVEGAL